MSQFNLFDDLTSKPPHPPNITHTLLFIETNRYVTVSSAVSLNKHINQV